jgi:hypothetical protein
MDSHLRNLTENDSVEIKVHSPFNSKLYCCREARQVT